jgi:hypothetical protein
VLCLVVAGCTSSGRSSVTPPSTSGPASASASPTTTPTASARAARTVWLCRPGTSPDPCTASRASTSIAFDGTRHVTGPGRAHASGLDCFYVYPTVSEEHRRNADLRIQPAETTTATAQASRFSSVCRVWAPMYEQRTVQDLTNLADIAPDSPANLHAFHSLESAWRDYLAHDNHGRPVVFIGHSQGAAMLIRLLRADIDPVPALRARMALAILLGGNVSVPAGKLTGGSFQHLPLCAHRGEVSCVIAYSSFPSTPPAFSIFGRPGAGVSSLSGETASAHTRIACVNPADVGGRSRRPLHPYFPTLAAASGASTPWTYLPDTYAGQCRSVGTATWLNVTPLHGAGDPRATLTEPLGAAWGYHIADVNLALGDLVADVAAVARHVH